MDTDTLSPATPAEASPLPLFYRQPQMLSSVAHRDLHLREARDFAFARGANAVPIMVAEFAEAQAAYPIVFAGAAAQPVAVLGLERDNLFVADDGAWAAERYIPAYVRRYPFVFIEATDGGRTALGIDAASDRLVAAPGGGEGLAALFDGDGPSPLTQEALRFSGAFQQSHLATRAFCDALVEHALLVDQQAHGAFPGGRRFDVRGFRIVDLGRLQALPDMVILDWHRRGWLALAHHHLASLGRWRDLLARSEPVDAPIAEPIEA